MTNNTNSVGNQLTVVPGKLMRRLAVVVVLVWPRGKHSHQLNVTVTNLNGYQCHCDVLERLSMPL